jgi:hypothetical protein
MPESRDAFSSEATNEAMKQALSDVSATKTPAPQLTLTFGQRLVGLTFNPSNDSGVDKAKRLCAELADLVYADYQNNEITELKNVLYHHTIGEILNAQMNAVKLLTLKY